MKAFDFDGTLYDGDSTFDFFMHCFVCHPSLIRIFPCCVFDYIKYKGGGIERDDFKERCFKRIVPRVDVPIAVSAFWVSKRRKIKNWCAELLEPGDIVISASPTFLLKPVCNELNVDLLATNVDTTSGVFLGPNLRGERKTAAFYACYGDAVPEEFFTDDIVSDEPMIKLSKRAYCVSGDCIQPIIAGRLNC